MTEVRTVRCRKMIEYYELVEVPYAYIERIKTKPFKRLLKSTNPQYSRLIVVDKENGGTKADASNAGINASSYPYFICTDVDCILESMLFTVVSLPLSPPTKQVIAVSGTMLMANGCEVKDGQIVVVRTPPYPDPAFPESGIYAFLPDWKNGLVGYQRNAEMFTGGIRTF